MIRRKYRAIASFYVVSNYSEINFLKLFSSSSSDITMYLLNLIFADINLILLYSDT